MAPVPWRTIYTRSVQQTKNISGEMMEIGAAGHYVHLLRQRINIFHVFIGTIGISAVVFNLHLFDCVSPSEGILDYAPLDTLIGCDQFRENWSRLIRILEVG